MLSIGLMSGTSMDGIDAALIETDGSEEIKELCHIAIPYDPAFKILLKAAEYTIRKCRGDIADSKSYLAQGIMDYLAYDLKLTRNYLSDKIAELKAYLSGNVVNQDITLDDIINHSTYLHGQVVTRLLEKSGYKAQAIDVIGYHGQAMFHQPAIKVSVIVGNGQYLADQLGITVVNDFRGRDIAAGGKGAPFAPLFHYALARRDNKIPVAVVNCGGIANITLVTNTNILDLIAFDTGPGNALIDRLIRYRTKGREHMDVDGKYGKQGHVKPHILTALYESSLIKDGCNYFAIKPPKALDVGDMTLISELESLSLTDACATLEAFTADTIVNSLALLDDIVIPRHWILAGGGWNNPVIKSELENRLYQKFGTVQIHTADEAGWNSQAMEAQLFAYFAVRSLQNKPLSFPGTTQVPKPMTGGHAYLPNTGATQKVVNLIRENPAVLSGYQGEV